MSDDVLVIAPHADDEVFGLGATLCKFRDLNRRIGLVLVSDLSGGHDRQRNVDKVREILSIHAEDYFFLGETPAMLDSISTQSLVEKIKNAVQTFEPSVVYVPCELDAHSDHCVVRNASLASLKWFRCHSVQRVFCYEVVSETNFGFGHSSAFRPNWYEDVSDFIDEKFELMNCYPGEVGLHPFPRSLEIVKANAIVRGSESGFRYAEAFKLIYARNK